MSECLACDDRGFVFEQVDETHRKQVLCPKCDGAPIRAKAMALLLCGENIKPCGFEREVFRNLPYERQIFLTMQAQLKQ